VAVVHVRVAFTADEHEAVPGLLVTPGRGLHRSPSAFPGRTEGRLSSSGEPISRRDEP
jgi:hypothetical protein